MSRSKAGANIARLNDLTLGAFSRVQPSETLDHLIRYLSTWSGSDKLFMLIQYGVKVLIPLLHLRARLQHRAGFRKDSVSHAAPSLNKIASIIGDARMLWRIWGLLPILQWLVALERSPSPTRRLLTIERAQGWSMLFYYPMEHLYYLLSHDVIPSSIPLPLPFLPHSRTPTDYNPASPTFSPTPKALSFNPDPNSDPPPSSLLNPPEAPTLSLNANKLGLWSTRFWALYVLLQLAHLREDRVLLKRRAKALSKEKGVSVAGGTLSEDRKELGRRWDAWWNELAVNLGYLPLTVHWSLEKGLFKNDIWVSLFGLFAAAASFRSGWKATALPPSVAPPLPFNTDGTEEPPLVGPGSEPSA